MSDPDPFKVPGEVIRALGESAEKLRSAPVRTELSAGQKVTLYLTTLLVVSGLYLATKVFDAMTRLSPEGWRTLAWLGGTAGVVVFALGAMIVIQVFRTGRFAIDRGGAPWSPGTGNASPPPIPPTPPGA